VVPLLLRRREESLPPLLPQLVGPLLILISSLPAGVLSLVPRTSRLEGARRLPVPLDYLAL
jgi:hypothetical protein